MDRSDIAGLVARAKRLAVPGSRHMLGITGAPAAGKSTLAEELVLALGTDAVLVPMDGFHLAEAELKRLGIHDRKGAPDTFDAAGYVALLERLSRNTEPVVYAPLFRRDLEEAIAGAIAVRRDVALVVTEGNYLLTEVGDWAAVRSLLDEVWYVELDEGSRIERLVQRHMAFGRDRHTATARAWGTDQRNAELVHAFRGRADIVVTDTRPEGPVGAR